jgi:preprotein translocase SecE subunit
MTMASATSDRDEKAMATDVATGGIEEREGGGGGEKPSLPAPRPVRSGGYFTLYKPGQGYWTRMGTAAAAALFAALVVVNLYAYLPSFGVESRLAITIVAVAFVAGLAWLVWHLMNKPANADFLIATDSEMKKVNWTSRRELIGSTKVVIGFMFLVAALLFVIDLLFQTIFYFINVLRIPPFFLS